MRIHGGRAEVALDFSVNINPLAPPSWVINIIREECVSSDIISRYPDYEYRALKEAVSSFYSIDIEGVVPLNGSSEGYILPVLMLRPSKVLAVEPTYGDHKLLAKVLQIEYNPIMMRISRETFVVDVNDVERFCRERGSLIIMSNPNNPTGIYLDYIALSRLFDRCDSWILIDEAYAEISTSYPLKPTVHSSNMIILRSFTKWLSIPGLRAGFIYADPSIAKGLDSVRPTWNVNSVAECVLRRILLDHADSALKLIEMSREYISRERERLADALKKLELKVFKSSTNFMLVRTEHQDLAEKLLGYGIAIRDCRSFEGLGPGFYRISVRKEKENDILINTLRMVLRV